MPVTYNIDKTKALIFTRCTGYVTFAEVLDHFKVLAQDPDCPGHLDVLLDLSESTSIPEACQLRAVSDQIGIVRKEVSFGACAIVAGREVLYGMSRVFEAFAAKWFQGIHVCRTEDEAKNWLTTHSTLAREQ